jgi:hypothetical protein
MHHGIMATTADTWDAGDAVRDVLHPEEVVLWVGEPNATRGLDRQDVGFIVVAGWVALAYWGVAFFGLVSSWTLTLRVLPPAIAIAYVVIARPAVRRSQQRKTAFALTASRALVVNGPPFPRFEAAALPMPYRVWTRSDGRGTVIFDSSPRSSERPSFPQGVRIALQVILFLVGLVARPFPSRRRDEVRLVFYEVGDVDEVVQSLKRLGVPEIPSEPSPMPRAQSGSWTQVVERRFTPTRRVLCAVLGVVLLASMIPVIAVRLRAYLQDSPTLSGRGTIEVTLPPATYVVFEHTAKVGPYDCSPVSVCVTIDPSNVSVVSQSGTQLSASVDPSMDGITDRSDHYAGAVEFSVSESGTYSVSIRSSTSDDFVIA